MQVLFEERLEKGVNLLVIEDGLAHDREGNQAGPTSCTNQPTHRSLARLLK
jgi:hypothetical protein